MRKIDLRVVLVRSIYERNVGASSRAMSNMDVTSLVLIDPKCEFTIESQKAAATGQHGLQNKIIYKSWDEFYKNEPESIRIAFTARDGRGRLTKDYAETLTNILENSPDLNKKSETPYCIHLIFGPEDWGLSTEDLENVHHACSIPTYGTNASLNLAQAVLLALFITRQQIGGERTKLDGQQPKRSIQSNVFPDSVLKEFLLEMGYDLNKPKINVFTVLRRLLLQNTPTQKELTILEGVLQQGIRKLKEYNSLKKN